MKCKKQVILGIAIILFVMLSGTRSMATTAIVNTDTLRLRKEASTDSTVIELLNQGQKLDIIEESEDWIKVKVNGMIGFVHKDYVKIEEIEEEEEKDNTVVETQDDEEVQNTVTDNNVVEQEDNMQDEQEKQEEKFTIREEILKNDSEVYILPLINANKIANLKKDEKVIIMDEVKGWYYIQTEQINGWIRNDLQEETNSNETNNTTNTNTTTNQTGENQNNNNSVNETTIKEKVMYVNYDSVYVRKGPGTEYEVVDSLILNNSVIVIAETGDWYKVKVDEKEGYIAKRLLSNEKTESTSRASEERKETNQIENEKQDQTTTNTSKGQEIANYAKQYLGCKYVYGGSGPSTFDCSGFTMYVYKHFGVSLSHSARAQSKNGTYVAKENLEPGDLVFFKDYETMDGIGHCGIYIGDGNFIHASSGTGYCVKISTLLSGSYYARYETARRLI